MTRLRPPRGRAGDAGRAAARGRPNCCARARCPFFGGLGTDTAGMRAVLALAERPAASSIMPAARPARQRPGDAEPGLGDRDPGRGAQASPATGFEGYFTIQNPEPRCRPSVDHHLFPERRHNATRPSRSAAEPAPDGRHPSPASPASGRHRPWPDLLGPRQPAVAEHADHRRAGPVLPLQRLDGRGHRRHGDARRDRAGDRPGTSPRATPGPASTST